MIVLQRAWFLTGPSVRKMLGNMKEVFIFLMAQNVEFIWNEMRKQANAHLPELLNGKLTHTTLAKVRT